MPKIIACLLGLTVLTGCAGQDAEDAAIRWVGKMALAACEAAPNCSTIDKGDRRRD
ncbi:MAG: hypothetical protein NXI18_09660 [Alphaproteobacteria bacterium]|nr:hypothetical protein [Alphaproteobacteria bacterium]